MLAVEIFSANAADVSVTGSLAVTYTNQHSSETVGNPLGMDNEFNFNISGEMDNGMTISYFQLLIAGSFSSSGLTLDMGDAGVLKLSNLCYPSEVCAVVKADAYGCGMGKIAKTLYNNGCKKFFVAKIKEGIEGARIPGQTA